MTEGRVHTENLYDVTGHLVRSTASGPGLLISWDTSDNWDSTSGANIGDVLYASISRLAAMAQIVPLDDEMAGVMQGLIAANTAWKNVITPDETWSKDRLLTWLTVHGGLPDKKTLDDLDKDGLLRLCLSRVEQ